MISGLRAGRMESPLAGNENVRGGIHFWEKLRTNLGHAILEMPMRHLCDGSSWALGHMSGTWRRNQPGGVWGRGWGAI